MRYRIKPYGRRYVASIDVPFHGSVASVGAVAVGDSKADAIGKAAQLAERIASDPIISALIPPQAKAAIQVAKGLAAASRRGFRSLKRAWGFLSPKSKHLAKELAVEVKEGTIGDVGWNMDDVLKLAAKAKAKLRKRKRKAKPAPEKEQEPDNEDEQTDEGGEE
jgi:hypothetical protein